MKDRLLRILGLSLLLDGVGLALFGRRYARLWRLRTEQGGYYRLVQSFVDLPPWLLPLLGLAEVVAGARMLGRAPLSVSAVYNTLAEPYSAIDTRWRDWLYAGAHHAFDEATAKYLPPGGDILDLGAGTGANLGRLLDMDMPFASYTGVDVTEAMLAQARQKYASLPQAQFRRLDLMTDPLPEGPFDLVISTWALEHMADPGLVVQKAWQQLGAGGHMVLLFEVEDESWYSRLENRVLGFFDAQQVPLAAVRQFPDLKRFDRFGGPFGKLGLVTLEKETPK
jgi:ubiquinone/menaquinone biosynthesis C-methylase UbiE